MLCFDDEYEEFVAIDERRYRLSRFPFLQKSWILIPIVQI